MLNLDIIGALINARTNLWVKNFTKGEVGVTPNEAVVTAALDSLPKRVADRAMILSLKQPLCAGQS